MHRAACTLLILSVAWLFDASAQSGEVPIVPGILPTGFGENVDRDVARLRAATERFKSADAAIAAGYTATTTCVAHPVHGVMGLHYKNFPLRDGTVDVEHPEILLYAPMPDGSVKLTGVEFVVPFGAWTRDEPPVLFMQPFHREETGKIWYLHVWAWEPNRDGLFADWNPALKC